MGEDAALRLCSRCSSRRPCDTFSRIECASLRGAKRRSRLEGPSISSRLLGRLRVKIASTAPPFMTLASATAAHPATSATSPADRLALLVSGELEEFGFDLREQARRDEAIAEYAALAWNRRKPAVRPLIHVVF